MSPDADGRIRPIAVPAAAWERIFGPAATQAEEEAFTEMEARSDYEKSRRPRS